MTCRVLWTPGSQRASLGGGSPLEFIGLKTKLADNDDGGEDLNSQGLQVMPAVVASPAMPGPTTGAAQKHGWTHGHVDIQPHAGGHLWDCLTAFCPEVSLECLLCQILLKALGN